MGCARVPVQIAVESVYSVPYDPRWPTLFERERDRVLPDRLLFLVKSAQASRSVRKYHLHVADVAGVFWERHLLFRDYLRAHPETANKYARLKYELAERFPRDVDAYALAKSAFVSAVVELARA